MNERVTARIVRTDDGRVLTEYKLDGITLPSAEAVNDALQRR